MTTEPAHLRTPVWLLLGLTRNRPGVLELSDGVIAFTGAEGRVFEARLTDVTGILFPWYYFGGGMKLTVAGTQHRISFVRPNGAELAESRLLEAAGAEGIGLLTAHRKLLDVGEGRRAGKAWKAALGTRA